MLCAGMLLLFLLLHAGWSWMLAKLAGANFWQVFFLMD